MFLNHSDEECMFKSEVFGKEPHGGLVLSDRDIHMDVRYFPFSYRGKKRERGSLLYLTYFVEYSKDCCQQIFFFFSCNVFVIF